ncbi:zinc-binding metallopeptidase family protein [Congregibacter sp.]|uniref:zinc-binding metallopeptidase family protein n=1 Tax=Congregibacter sp. TaxID=2744308 RepID=UPI003F6C2C13
MRRFACDCGSAVYFENDFCINCQSALGYDPSRADLITLADWGEGIFRDFLGNAFRYCSNGELFGVCNWLRPADSPSQFCTACQFNRTVPDQSRPENQERWLVLERGKKRLFYTLAQLKLPMLNGWADPQRGLLLDFIEDARTSEKYPETFVSTGYLGGVITINAVEADDVARVTVQDELGESYRTVLGHLRHESGHYYWSLLNPEPRLLEEFRKVFGDERLNYQAALDTHYQSGPPPGWRGRFISSYASAHPSEDWAECWGHYLHIYDALDTAWAHQLLSRQPEFMSMSERLRAWSKVSLMLNELNRSVGRGDAYPFVINEVVAEKLELIDLAMDRLRTLR